MNQEFPDLPIKLATRTYRRRFRRPLQTAHGEWAWREGLVVRIETADGRVGYGEAAPVTGFGAETISDVAPAAEALKDIVSIRQLVKLDLPPTLDWAVECAGLTITGGMPVPENVSLPVAGLLSADDSASERMQSLLQQGVTIFKLKVGVCPASIEQTRAEQILALLPDSGKLRLDANGGLGEAYPLWLDWCREHAAKLDYLEQPQLRGRESQMLTEAKRAGVPVALDESVAGMDSLVEMAERFPDAVFIIKPTLLGSLSRFLNWRSKNPELRRIYSSCFETGIGFRQAWALAASDPHPEAAGLGVVDFIENDGLCPVEVRAKLSHADFTNDWEETIWSRL